MYRTYHHYKINNSPNSHLLFKTFSSLLCPPPPLPSSTLTADDFEFFINTVTNLTGQFSTPQSVKHILPANINSFTYFSPLSEAEVSKLILSSYPTTCPLDPIPCHLLQAISPAVVPALTHIVNTSLHTGGFPSAFKQARITPLLKNPTLNPTLSSCGSVVEHCVSSAKAVGSITREHMYWPKYVYPECTKSCFG